VSVAVHARAWLGVQHERVQRLGGVAGGAARRSARRAAPAAAPRLRCRADCCAGAALNTPAAARARRSDTQRRVRRRQHGTHAAGAAAARDLATSS
jgi:hypothetical protein